MKLNLTLLLLVLMTLTSCKFSCHAGSLPERSVSGQDNPIENVAKKIKTAAVYNGIDLDFEKIKLTQAYLVDANTGNRISDDNFIEGNQKINLLLLSEGGWSTEQGKVFLSCSYKVLDKAGNVVMNKEDMFAPHKEKGMNSEDANTIGLSLLLELPANAPPQIFSVYFDLKETNSTGYIKGAYKVYSK